MYTKSRPQSRNQNRAQRSTGAKKSRPSSSGRNRQHPSRRIYRIQKQERYQFHFVNLLRERLKSGTFDKLHEMTLQTVKVKQSADLPRHIRRGSRNAMYEENMIKIAFHAVQQGKLMSQYQYNALLDEARELARAQRSAKKTRGGNLMFDKRRKP